MNVSNSNKKLGFTLAEVLITLGIVGIVASMTIPILMNQTNETELKTSYKKAFSIASQAWLNMVGNNENVDLPTSSNLTPKLINFYYFKSYFKITKECGTVTSTGTVTTADISDCWATNELYGGSYPNKATGIAFIDNAGISWALADAVGGGTSNTIMVDVNGNKGPNKMGQDVFAIVPKDISGSRYGTLIKIDAAGDCISGTNCDINKDGVTNEAETTANYCPDAAIHPCYYSAWLSN